MESTGKITHLKTPRSKETRKKGREELSWLKLVVYFPSCFSFHFFSYLSLTPSKNPNKPMPNTLIPQDYSLLNYSPMSTIHVANLLSC